MSDAVVLGAAIALLLTLGALAWFPTSRPYAKRYGWLIVIAVGTLLGYLLFMRPRGKARDDAGHILAEQSSSALSAIIDHAEEQMSWADAELARKRLESQVAVERMEAELDTVKKIDSSLERRKALIKVVESYS